MHVYALFSIHWVNKYANVILMKDSDLPDRPWSSGGLRVGPRGLALKSENLIHLFCFAELKWPYNSRGSRPIFTDGRVGLRWKCSRCRQSLGPGSCSHGPHAHWPSIRHPGTRLSSVRRFPCHRIRRHQHQSKFEIFQENCPRVLRSCCLRKFRSYWLTF